MGRQVEPVRIGDTQFFVEVVDAGGPRPAGAGDLFSFDGVRDTVEAIAGQIGKVWERVKPTEASVEFGLALTGKTGKLTGLLVEADGDASLKVTVVWRAESAT